MSYQELVEKSRKAYKKNNLKNAWKYWCQINDIYFEKLDKYDKYDEINRKKCFEEYDKYIRQFTDEEVYDICGYGRDIEYTKMGYKTL